MQPVVAVEKLQQQILSVVRLLQRWQARSYHQWSELTVPEDVHVRLNICIRYQFRQPLTVCALHGAWCLGGLRAVEVVVGMLAATGGSQV